MKWALRYARNEEGIKASSIDDSQSICGKLVHPKEFGKPGLKEVQPQNTQAQEKGARLGHMQHTKGKSSLAYEIMDM